LIKKLKQLGGDTAIYGVSNVIGRVIGIFLVPFYTKVLLPADYGNLNIINSIFFIVTVFSILSIDNSATRWYYDTDIEAERKKIISTWFWTQTVFTVLLCTVIIIFSSFLSQKILNSSDSLLFTIPAIGLITNILPTMVTSFLRFQRKPIKVVSFSIGNVLLNISLNIYLVLFLHLGVKGILIASLISTFAASIFGFLLMKNWIGVRNFSKKY